MEIIMKDATGTKEIAVHLITDPTGWIIVNNVNA